MPRYHFNVHDGREIADEDGTDLPDVTAARQEALRYAGLLLADSKTFWNDGEWKMEVADANGLILFSLTFLATDAPTLRPIGPE